MDAKSDYSALKGLKSLLIIWYASFVHTVGDILKISNNKINYFHKNKRKKKFDKQNPFVVFIYQDRL